MWGGGLAVLYPLRPYEGGRILILYAVVGPVYINLIMNAKFLVQTISEIYIITVTLYCTM